jgi:hypothetical protein
MTPAYIVIGSVVGALLWFFLWGGTTIFEAPIPWVPLLCFTISGALGGLLGGRIAGRWQNQWVTLGAVLLTAAVLSVLAGFLGIFALWWLASLLGAGA